MRSVDKDTVESQTPLPKSVVFANNVSTVRIEEAPDRLTIEHAFDQRSTAHIGLAALLFLPAPLLALLFDPSALLATLLVTLFIMSFVIAATLAPRSDRIIVARADASLVIERRIGLTTPILVFSRKSIPISTVVSVGLHGSDADVGGYVVELGCIIQDRDPKTAYSRRFFAVCGGELEPASNDHKPSADPFLEAITLQEPQPPYLEIIEVLGRKLAVPRRDIILPSSGL
jgi:hypothetical protein